MLEFNTNGDGGVLLLTFIVSTILPLLVGIVTTRVDSPMKKALYLIALSFGTSILSEILDAISTGLAYDITQGIFKFGTIATIAIASYFGVWSRPMSSGESLTDILIDKVGRTAGPGSS